MVSLSNHAYSAGSALIIVMLVCWGCGKKGAPLPPLVKLPVAPGNLVAERRGNIVNLQFTVPGTNTDGTRPANVSRAEVYAITIPITSPALTDEQLLKLGSKVGGVQVKAPRNPELTADADDPSEEIEAPEGPGLVQGAPAQLEEPLTVEMLTPVDVPADPKARATTAAADDAPRPLLAPLPAVLLRTYVAYATSTRGRKGPLSPRIAVPLVPPPPPPPAPAITYDESNVTVTWPAVGTRAPIQAPTDGADGEVLPSTPIEAPRPTIAYNVYDTSNPSSAVKLTTTPVPEPRFADGRMVWV